MSFERYVLPDEDTPGEFPKLNVHFYRGVMQEYLDEKKTGAECRTEFEAHLGVTLTTNDVTNITDLLAYINAGSDAIEKFKRADEPYRIFMLAEGGCTWYNTRAEVRTRLGWSV